MLKIGIFGSKLDISPEKHLRKTIEQLAFSPPSTGLHFDQERRDLLSLGGFPEILSNQWMKTKDLVKQMEQVEQLEKQSKELERLLKEIEQTPEGKRNKRRRKSKRRKGKKNETDNRAKYCTS